MAREWQKSKPPVSERYRKLGLFLLVLITVVFVVIVLLLAIFAISLMQDGSNSSGWQPVALFGSTGIFVWLWIVVASRLNRFVYRIHFIVEGLDS